MVGSVCGIDGIRGIDGQMMLIGNNLNATHHFDINNDIDAWIDGH